MKKIKTWVEIFTTQNFQEETHEVPDNWERMTEAEQDLHMRSLFDSQRDEVANGGYCVEES